MNNTIKLITTITTSLLAGVIGSFFTASSIPIWYATLVRPVLNPPNWVFGPVWTVLYILMGIAAFLVWKKGWDNKDIQLALTAFGFQLILNTTWSIVFFGLQSPAWAFVNIIAMWFAIIWTMILFYKISKLSMYLLLPYILWVSFAAYLNFAIWSLNA